MTIEETIDIHLHFIPPFYRSACVEQGYGKPDGMPAIPEWNEEIHLNFMKDNAITKSIISISLPGVHLASANSSKGNPKIRFWAALPLPDVDSSLAEISYVLGNLKSNAFVMETNFHGTYLGDSSINAVFDELNRVKATVFLYPTTPCFKHNGDSTGHNHTAVTFPPQFPNPLMEFMFDTARALINLFSSGTLARCPDITFVVPHAGGALPPVLQRFCTFATVLMRSELDLSDRAVKETFRMQFYFDLAGFPFPDQIYGLLRIVGPERLVYGSDHPFTPAPLVAHLAETMSVGLKEAIKDSAARAAIYAGNAKRLLGMEQ